MSALQNMQLYIDGIAIKAIAAEVEKTKTTLSDRTHLNEAVKQYIEQLTAEWSKKLFVLKPPLKVPSNMLKVPSTMSKQTSSKTGNSRFKKQKFSFVNSEQLN
jgi:hypothetical protein